ncbi:ABC transporter ATP-binding protein [Iamia sp. SCSIO 61187]|uniref:ABC transporter ATP-binding protein n=1 Tax=Iamia sp. SCSIO 61187 TaxID=2722752 RepID=UPI001C63B396|nr:ABC transporter ATP-binding protein [Iamia sp. SCSIO 61187]QYG91028.1 ABC transporter ATP-binding protein [Iamia sp. SCSIO 61187]
MTARPAPVAAAPTVRLHGITKAYPGVVANDGIDLTLEAGTVHGLLGENGAGKSTLMKVLFGLVPPDAGTIEVDGQERRFRSPADALAAGIGMVQQHFSLVPDFTVAENLVLGHEPRRRGRLLVDRTRAESEVQHLADRYGFRLDVTRRVADLAVGARQRVEILKALHRGARVLILDEPTAALAPPEVAELAAVLARLTAEGCTVVFIGHKLTEIVALCDEVTVLRDGAVVASRSLADHERVEGPARQRLEEELSVAMVGRPLPPAPARAGAPGPVVLRLDGASDGHDLGPVDLAVHAGEIVGVAGVEGNGQTELVELVLGVRRCRTGRVALGDADVTRWPVARRLEAGLAHIAEDRHTAAVALDLTLAENCALGHHTTAPVAPGRFRLSRPAMDRLAAGVVERYGVRTSGLGATLRQLSGGNQQKLVVGREVARAPRLIVAAQPTRGLDVGATAFVHEELARLRAAGCAVLLVSLDLAEITAVADRIVVLRDGSVAGETAGGDADATLLGVWMTGAHEDAA